MVKRLLVIVVGLLLLAACAKTPAEDLEETRQITAKAYAAGASRLAPDEYRIAREALAKAEERVKQGAYAEAEGLLVRARAYTYRALKVTDERKKRYQEVQRRLAEEKARQLEKQRAEEERKRAVEAEEQPKTKLQTEPKSVSPPEPVPELVDLFEVGEEDTLASIAARQEVYAEELLWPLIYKANRDQIKDPKQIFPGQLLKIPRDKTPEELDAARKEALELDIF